MANQVYANNMEVSCKAADGKSVAAFPDVCFTPPTAPPTPPGVPLPYPNTGMASDCTSGSKTVTISGKEVMLKDKSYFKQSTGDEAGSAPKKGIMTSVNKGKVYFTSWSMDVKVEGENVVRHFDMTTHNHASMPTNTPPWPYTDAMTIKALNEACARNKRELKSACEGQSVSKCTKACKDAQKCFLPPKGKDKEWCCKPNNTGHHMIEDHWVKGAAGFAKASTPSGYKGAPTVCVNRFRSIGSDHREMHNIQGVFEESFIPKKDKWTYAEGKKATLKAHSETFADSDCAPKCVEAQLDAFYGKDGKRKLNEPSKQAIGEDRAATESKYIKPTPRKAR